MVSRASWLLLIGLVCFSSTTERTKTKHNAPQESFVDQCTPVPTWTVGGERAVSLVGQKITVIAILNSNSAFGRQQAAMLSLLRSRLYDAGFPAINFMVINSMSATRDTGHLRFEAASIPVYQEQPGEAVREILGAGNDHILVLDRCGRMVYQVITPFSKLTCPYAKAAILSTYKDNPCGFCNITNGGAESSNDSPTDSRVSLEQENRDGDDQAKITRMSQLQGETRGNGLTQSFIQTMDVPDPYMYGNVTLQTRTQNASFPYRSGFSYKAELVNLTHLAKAQNRTILHDSGKHGDDVPQLRIQGYPGHIANWNWLENQNNQSENEASDESSEQSVEVLHQEESSTRKEKREKSNDRSDNSNSYEASDDSVKKLVNQTQVICEGLWQQTENSNSSEEKQGRSNILKEKIIEHYRKLLPWINYRLAPKVES